MWGISVLQAPLLLRLAGRSHLQSAARLPSRRFCLSAWPTLPVPPAPPQARERAPLEVQRKEEELVALAVRAQETEGALREYKRENAKFFEVKERYKGALAGLEAEVQVCVRGAGSVLEIEGSLWLCAAGAAGAR